MGRIQNFMGDKALRLLCLLSLIGLSTAKYDVER